MGSKREDLRVQGGGLPEGDRGRSREAGREGSGLGDEAASCRFQKGEGSESTPAPRRNLSPDTARTARLSPIQNRLVEVGVVVEKIEALVAALPAVRSSLSWWCHRPTGRLALFSG